MRGGRYGWGDGRVEGKEVRVGGGEEGRGVRIIALTCYSTSVSKSPHSRVSEPHQPDDQCIQHVLVIYDAVLAVLKD